MKRARSSSFIPNWSKLLQERQQEQEREREEYKRSVMFATPSLRSLKSVKITHRRIPKKEKVTKETDFVAQVEGDAKGLKSVVVSQDTVPSASSDSDPEVGGSDSVADESESESDCETLVAGFPPVKMKERLIPTLLPHQLAGIHFVLKRLTSAPEGAGCILAHSMGMGKSLSAICVIKLFQQVAKNARRPAPRILLSVPVSTTRHWRCQFEKWCHKKSMPAIYIMALCRKGGGALAAFEKKSYTDDWARGGGVMIISHGTARSLMLTNKKGLFGDIGARLRKDTDMLVVDEGQRIKNPKSALFGALNRVTAKRRLLLSGFLSFENCCVIPCKTRCAKITGTPLQNSLAEFYCMACFVLQDGSLGSLAHFRQHFEVPILRGICSDSSKEDVELMQLKLTELQYKLKDFVHRAMCHSLIHLDRSSSSTSEIMDESHTLMDASSSSRDALVLMGSLPCLYQCVLVVNPSRVQAHLLEALGKNTSTFLQRSLLQRLVTNHPCALKAAARRGGVTCSRDGVESDEEDEDFKESNSDVNKRSKTNANERIDLTMEDSDSLRCNTEDGAADMSWWEAALKNTQWKCLGSDACPCSIRWSGKTALLNTIVVEATKRREKVVVFSQSLPTLDVLEEQLSSLRWHQSGDASGPSGSTARETVRNIIVCLRFDGSLDSDERQNLLDKFNNSSGPGEPNVLLVSTTAGSLGICMTGANHVVLFEPSWNPAMDIQALCRVWRFGQSKPVHVCVCVFFPFLLTYRLLAAGNEEQIFQQQLRKQSLSVRVLDWIPSSGHSQPREGEIREAPNAKTSRHDESSGHFVTPHDTLSTLNATREKASRPILEQLLLAYSEQQRHNAPEGNSTNSVLFRCALRDPVIMLLLPR